MTESNYEHTTQQQSPNNCKSSMGDDTHEELRGVGSDKFVFL